jgi:hypothetical protein
VTLILDDIPAQLDEALRARARAEGKSVGQVAVEAIRTGLAVAAGVSRDLSDFAGSMSATDARAIEETVREMDLADLRSRSDTPRS